MNGDPPSIDAVEWREAAPGGGSKAQVFRLEDERFVIVKFRENPQGEIVLTNEFLCCQLAAEFNLPINEALIVQIPPNLLETAKKSGMPNEFTAGLACGMIRVANSETAEAATVQNQCSNHLDLHEIAVFEQVVCRQDGRQLLMYTLEDAQQKRLLAYDYGFAFGGNPVWSAATLAGAAAAVLPANDPFAGQPYADGVNLAGFIAKLRNLTKERLTEIFMRISPPRWGVTEADVTAAIDFVSSRVQSLIEQFDQRYPPEQMEINHV